MDDPIDPYHKWLGIPWEEQPSDHYRLLGIARFESDPDVISNAADQRMAYIRQFQQGPHAELAAKLLNEIATARVCLLSPQQGKAEVREEYNRQLRNMVRPEPPSPIPLAQAVPEQTQPRPVLPIAKVTEPTVRKPPPPIVDSGMWNHSGPPVEAKVVEAPMPARVSPWRLERWKSAEWIVGGVIAAGILLLVVVVGIGIMAGSSNGRTHQQREGGPKEPQRKERVKQYEPDVVAAWVATQTIVERYVKSPSTVDWGSVFGGDYQNPEEQVSYMGQREYVVNGWVDAQNAFGAVVRTYFELRIKDLGDSWRLVGEPVFTQR